MKVAGFVLAGGRSTRMGRDKALLELCGEPLIARALRTLGEVCAEVAIAGGSPELAQFGQVVPDASPGAGPLSGIVAGLAATRREWNCFLAVDVPFVPAAAWRSLLSRAGGSGAAAVLPRIDGRVQPLCGVYARSGLQILRAELAAGRGKVMDALDKVGTVHWVDFAEEAWFRNLNTPRDFAQAEAHLRNKAANPAAASVSLEERQASDGG